jgi:hypothetical protein
VLPGGGALLGGFLADEGVSGHHGDRLRRRVSLDIGYLKRSNGRQATARILRLASLELMAATVLGSRKADDSRQLGPRVV